MFKHATLDIYIGSMQWHLYSRIQEHLGNSIYTSQPLTEPSFSAIMQFAYSCDHRLKDSQFRIIDSAWDSQTLLIKETMHILDKQPHVK